jgi:periplasmic divalent cation tolerance protein
MPIDPSPELVVVFSTVPDRETGVRIGRALVEEHLIACANLVPGLTSIYRWEGEVRADDELLLIMKTARARTPALTDRFAELHPYAVPELITLPVVSGLPAYCAWVATETEEAAV